MAYQVKKHLYFVEKGENLLPSLIINPIRFIEEICGIGSELMKKAVQWLKAQECFEVEGIAAAFYTNFLPTDRTEEYFAMAKCLSSLLENFESLLSTIAQNAMKELLRPPIDQPSKNSLLRTADLVNGLCSLEISTSEAIDKVMRVTLKAKIENTLRIKIFKILLKRNVIQILKKDKIDERFVLCIASSKATIGAKDFIHSMTIEELRRLANTLIGLKFLPSDALQYDKMDKVNSILANWCNDTCNLKKTLAAFSALSLKDEEEFAYVSNGLSSKAIKENGKQDKLVILQVHLLKETFKDQIGYTEVTRHLLLDYIVQSFTDVKVAAMEQNHVLLNFLIILYNEGAINHDIIEACLSLLAKLPADIGHPRYAKMLLKVDDKFKTETSSECYGQYSAFMKGEVIGNKRLTELPPECTQWLIKKRHEEKDQANQLKRQQAEAKLKASTSTPRNSIGPTDIGDAIQGFCLGVYTLSQTLAQYEPYKAVPFEYLGYIPQDLLGFGMNKDPPHKQLTVLLKNLIRKTFRSRASEFYVIVFEILQFHVKEYLHYTSEVNLERNMCFVKFIIELFVQDVIGEKVIVQSLDALLDDWGGAGDDCFAELFTKVQIKLKPKISEEKFEEFSDHFENYIIANRNEVHPVQQPCTSTENEVQHATVQKKNLVPRRVQRMIVNLYDLEGPEKLNETVDNLRKLLGSENRKKIFVKYMLERPKNNLKQILLHSKLLVALTKVSDQRFEFKSFLTNTIQSEYIRTNATANSNKSSRAKLNRIEILSGELWRNNLMATKRFAGLMMSKNMSHLPTESLAHLSMIVGNAIHSDGNSKLKLAVRTFEPFIKAFTEKGWSDLKDNLDDVGAELQMLLSYEASLA